MIAVLLSCFNRQELTSNILSKFLRHSEVFDLFVVDGGSTDETCENLNALSKSAENLHFISEEDFYWAESMRLAWKIAREKKEYSGYLLVNDDLEIDPERLDEFISEMSKLNESDIYVGQCLDSSRQNITYGGLVRKSLKSRIHFRIGKAEEQITTFNANFVYVPKEVVSTIGILSGRFRHSFADIDYGLRATKNQIRIRLIEKPIGITNYNNQWASSLTNLNFSNYKAILFNPKGLPINEWYIFCKRHAGPFWIIYFLFRYIRMILKSNKLVSN